MKATGKIHFADLSVKNLTKVFPLPLIFLFNTVSGLGGTKKISLPMFTVLRRLTMLFTIIAERCVALSRQRSPSASPSPSYCTRAQVSPRYASQPQDSVLRCCDDRRRCGRGS